MRSPLQILALVVLMASLASGGAPVTKAQLLSMAKEKVDAKVIMALVERDCIDFDLDASNASELSRELPPEVLEAAIRCRRAAAAPEPNPTPSAAPAPERRAEPAPPLPAAARAPAPPGPGELRIRAEFIGESGALTCACLLDGQPFAILAKPEQGEYGQAVARDRLRKESAFLPAPAGRHTLLFRCDPHGQELTREIELRAGERLTVEIGETLLRRWKVRKVRTGG